MSDTLKKQLWSALTTFVTTAIVVLGSTIASSGTIEWTGTFWVSVLFVVARAAIKAAVEGFKA